MPKRFTALLLCLSVSVLLVSCAARLAEHKDRAEVFRLVGEGYLSEGNATEALKELLKAEKLYDKDPILQYDLGLAYFAKGELDLAIVHFKKAVTLKPDYSEALNNMGAVYLRLEQWDKAVKCFDRALDNLLYATPHFALSNLGEAYRGKKDFERSIDSYEQALKREPRFFRAHRGLGLTHMAMGNFEAAISCLEKAVQYASRFAPAHYDLGRAHARNHDREKATAAFKKVVELVPDSPLADQARAEIRKLQRN